MSKKPDTARKSEAPVDKDYPLDHVPMSARQSLLSLSCVLIGFTFFTPTMASGAMLGRAFPFDQLCLVISVGSLILGVYVATMCYISAKTGLTAVLQSRYTFGTAGAKWADISAEQLAAWDPEVIFSVSYAEYTLDDIRNNAALAGVKAVAEDRLHTVPSEIEAWDYPQPSSILGLLWMSHILHPDLVTQEDYVDEAKAFYKTYFDLDVTEAQLGLG